MGTIDTILFRRAGAADSGNSDFNLVLSRCCRKYFVEDSELNDLYFDPHDPSKRLSLLEQGTCPVCSKPLKFDVLPEWPREETEWMWAYHPDRLVVKRWIDGN